MIEKILFFDEDWPSPQMTNLAFASPVLLIVISTDSVFKESGRMGVECGRKQPKGGENDLAKTAYDH
jgi:hypothetical protein